MPKALMLGPLIVLSIYVLYFIGISCYVTPEVVMTLGDRHVSLAAQNLFGPALVNDYHFYNYFGYWNC